MPKRASLRRTSATQDQRPTGREVIGFTEKYLHIAEGPNAGQPLILAPWQRQELHCTAVRTAAGATSFRPQERIQKQPYVCSIAAQPPLRSERAVGPILGCTAARRAGSKRR
jgi:hypothetical protein